MDLKQTNNILNVNKELYSCYKFFMETYSKKECSFGLVLDAFPNYRNDIASIAGTGFFYNALVVGVECGFIKRETAYDIAFKAIKTLFKLKNDHGWFYHFYLLSSGEPNTRSEISTIDTALLIAGVLVAGSYFKSEIEKMSLELLDRLDFPYFLQTYKTMFSMSKEFDGTFRGHWDRYAEQLLLYVLGRANITNPMPKEIYYSFIRDVGKYGDYEYIYSWRGSLFTYQYSQGFIDFRKLFDRNGTNWFTNSKNASLAAYQYTIDNEGKFQSFHRLSWGQTACANVDGYSGSYGTPPTGENISFLDGTVAPCAAIGSIVFTSKESIDAINYFYTINELIGDYGLFDSYNEDKRFYCPYYISIDKGISLTMLSNYLYGTIWKYFMSIDRIQQSLNDLEIKERK